MFTGKKFVSGDKIKGPCLLQ